MTVEAPSPERTEGRQGHYAGIASRIVGFALDIGAIWGLFLLGAGAVGLAKSLVVGGGLTLRDDQIAVWVGVGLWALFYFSYQWSLSGKTLGMAILGLQVVRADGSPANAERAVLRTLALPLTLLFLPVGLLVVLVSREHRGIHDLVAGTAVVYAWDARAARLRWLAREPVSAGRRGRGRR